MSKDKETLEQEGAEQVAEKASSESDKESKSGRRKKKRKSSDELIEIQQELGELKEKYLRLFAEFDNYKKRNVKERMELINSAAKNTLTSILPILDDFDRAKKSADDENSSEVFSEGVSMVYKRLYSVLEQQGLEAMDSDGESFDPEFHEAISEIPAPNEDQKGIIIDTIEKGYLLNDKIIRHAKVVVGK